LTGTGTNEPSGILNIGGLNGLTTTQRVQTTTTAVYALGDPWLLKAALRPRDIPNTTFAAAPGIWDLTFRFIGGNSTEPLQFGADGRGGDFLGRPKFEWSSMVTTTTTASRIMLAGDFSAYVIADRIGMSAEIIGALFDQATGRPTGQRGWFARWRTAAGVAVPEAFRYLEVK
jgi:HK97 family phage major capsid protein